MLLIKRLLYNFLQKNSFFKILLCNVAKSIIVFSKSIHFSKIAAHMRRSIDSHDAKSFHNNFKGSRKISKRHALFATIRVRGKRQHVGRVIANFKKITLNEIMTWQKPL